MNHSIIISLLAVVTGLFSVAPAVNSQSKVTSGISYNVPFGPVFPIEASSSQLNGQIGLNDTTGILKKLSFEVQLNSFIGQNANYLAWIGNSWTYPYLRFKSNNISRKDDTWFVKGNLEFRNCLAPVMIPHARTDKNVEFYRLHRPSDGSICPSRPERFDLTGKTDINCTDNYFNN